MKIARLADIVDPAATRRIVVKVGSSLLVERGEPRRDWLRGLVAELAEAYARGQQVILVSSGSIALGAARLSLEKGGRASLADAQAAAAVGQIALSGLWAGLLEERGLTAAQLLLTLDDLEDRRRYLNATATLTRLLDAGAVPVINENDSVATEEIRFGDNDRLAARVAQAAGADAVMLLSDVDGLYDRDPAADGALLIPSVRGVDDDTMAMATNASGSGMGSGGMLSKLQAAQIAERAGIALAILNGTHDRPIARALGDERGTLFLPVGRAGARKAWLGGRMKTRGNLHIDGGAAKALREGGSLLATGIVAVDGRFARGDLIAVIDPEGTQLAHGLVEYDAAECERLMGKRTLQHEKILGYAPRPAVVHRNQMVLA